MLENHGHFFAVNYKDYKWIRYFFLVAEAADLRQLYVRDFELLVLIVIITTLIISKKPGNTGISRDIRTEFTTDLLLSD